MLQKLGIFKGEIDNNDNFQEFFQKEATIMHKDVLSLQYFLKNEKDSIQKQTDVTKFFKGVIINNN